jgi:holo-[acyl-carrier protein] synthase
MLDKIGIGIDLVKIEKFKKFDYKTNSNFYHNIFTSSEIKYCLKFSEPYEHFAGKFALKEAVIKSIGKKIPLTSIFTDHKNFQPIVKIENSSEYSFLATLSHEDEFAIAVIISEKF